jgi:predicted GNAT family acetyltransferase
MTDTTTDVVDEPQHDRFRFTEDGTDAQLVYRVDGDRLILVHTEVPEALGGRGIAGRLVRAAVDRAERTGETVVPWCPYARTWLRDHPDVAAAVSIDWSPPPA